MVSLIGPSIINNMEKIKLPILLSVIKHLCMKYISISF